MSNDKYFELPETGNDFQENIDRERERKTKSRGWSIRSQADRNRARRPKVRVAIDPESLKPFVNSNNKESQILLPTQAPTEIIRDLPVLQPRVTELDSAEIPEDPNEFYNPDHYAGLHKDSPDLYNCAACQRKARKTAINSAINKRNKAVQKYHSFDSATKSQVRALMQDNNRCNSCGTIGHTLENAIEHVRKNAHKYGLESWEDEDEGAESGRPFSNLTSSLVKGVSRHKTNFDKALDFLGIEMNDTEKAIQRQVHYGKSYEDIVFAFRPDLKDQVIASTQGINKDTKPSGPFTGVEEVTKRVIENPKNKGKFKTDINGNLVPWEQKDYIHFHTAELRKAQHLGDKKNIEHHERQLAIYQGKSPVKVVVKPNPEGKVWKKGIVSKEDAWKSLQKADETGEPQCALGCNLDTMHKQCPEHGQLLFNE